MYQPQSWPARRLTCATASFTSGSSTTDRSPAASFTNVNLTRAKLSDVTKVTIYICNPHDVPKARGLLQTYFEGHPPGSTLCILRGLAHPSFLLEIEAIAAV